MFAGDVSVKPFDKTAVEWDMDAEYLISQGFDVGEYTMKMEREGVERKIIVSYYVEHSGSVYPKYPPPA